MDINRLISSQPELRTKTVKVKELKGWPGVEKGEIPEFKVRMLTLAEFDQVREAPQTEKLAQAMIEKLGSVTGTAETLIEAALGDPDVPETTKRKLKLVMLGTVEPALDQRSVNWLAKYQPMVIEMLFSQISQLTGLGAAPPGKSSRSGTTRKSAALSN